MHSYLRAIGFANITKESEVEKLLEDVYKKFDHREAVREDDTAFIEMEKEFAPDMGIKLCGDVDGDGFHRQYYFPYYKGRSVTTSEEVSVERRVNGDSFAGICDDGRVGVSLIFYLQNAARYRQEQILNQLKGIPVLKPKQVLFDKPMVVSFEKPKVKNQYYVYALGSLQGVYEKASYAIQEAEKIKGVVISSSQEYVWESGNTPDIYEVNNMDEFRTGEGESTLAACLNRILKLEGAEDINASTELENGKSPAEILTEATGGEGFDLTGCTPEEIQYTISHETPVVAMLSADHAVLVIGYTSEKYAYIDPADGERHSATPEEMAQMVSGSGNVFFGYVK